MASVNPRTSLGSSSGTEPAMTGAARPRQLRAAPAAMQMHADTAAYIRHFQQLSFSLQLSLLLNPPADLTAEQRILLLTSLPITQQQQLLKCLPLETQRQMIFSLKPNQRMALLQVIQQKQQEVQKGPLHRQQQAEPTPKQESNGSTQVKHEQAIAASTLPSAVSAAYAAAASDPSHWAYIPATYLARTVANEPFAITIQRMMYGLGDCSPPSNIYAAILLQDYIARWLQCICTKHLHKVSRLDLIRKKHLCAAILSALYPTQCERYFQWHAARRRTPTEAAADDDTLDDVLQQIDVTTGARRTKHAKGPANSVDATESDSDGDPAPTGNRRRTRAATNRPTTAQQAAAMIAQQLQQHAATVSSDESDDAESEDRRHARHSAQLAARRDKRNGASEPQLTAVGLHSTSITDVAAATYVPSLELTLSNRSRLERLAKLTGSMSDLEYAQYSDARKASFTTASGNSSQQATHFRHLAMQSADKPTAAALTALLDSKLLSMLGFLAYERVGTVIDVALHLREHSVHVKEKSPLTFSEVQKAVDVIEDEVPTLSIHKLSTLSTTPCADKQSMRRLMSATSSGSAHSVAEVTEVELTEGEEGAESDDDGDDEPTAMDDEPVAHDTSTAAAPPPPSTNTLTALDHDLLAAIAPHAQSSDLLFRAVDSDQPSRTIVSAAVPPSLVAKVSQLATDGATKQKITQLMRDYPSTVRAAAAQATNGSQKPAIANNKPPNQTAHTSAATTAKTPGKLTSSTHISNTASTATVTAKSTPSTVSATQLSTVTSWPAPSGHSTALGQPDALQHTMTQCAIAMEWKFRRQSPHLAQLITQTGVDPQKFRSWMQVNKPPEAKRVAAKSPAKRIYTGKRRRKGKKRGLAAKTNVQAHADDAETDSDHDDKDEQSDDDAEGDTQSGQDNPSAMFGDIPDLPSMLPPPPGADHDIAFLPPPPYAAAAPATPSSSPPKKRGRKPKSATPSPPVVTSYAPQVSKGRRTNNSLAGDYLMLP